MIVANSYQKIIVPDVVDFGWCAIDIAYEKKFVIGNRSSTPLYFQWDYHPGVLISPMTGILPGRGTIDMKVSLICVVSGFENFFSIYCR